MPPPGTRSLGSLYFFHLQWKLSMCFKKIYTLEVVACNKMASVAHSRAYFWRIPITNKDSRQECGNNLKIKALPILMVFQVTYRSYPYQNLTNFYKSLIFRSSSSSIICIFQFFCYQICLRSFNCKLATSRVPNVCLSKNFYRAIIKDLIVRLLEPCPCTTICPQGSPICTLNTIDELCPRGSHIVQSGSIILRILFRGSFNKEFVNFMKI